jgi:hypothetical protein
MLDVHSVVVTPGAVAVLGVGAPTVSVGDGAPVAGVPIDPKAVLMMYGFLSITADSIARLKLSSQDMIDPINGEDFTLGAASLLCEFHRYINLPYKTGQRLIQAGTNVGVVAGTGFLIDDYQGKGQTMGDQRSKFLPKRIIPGSITFGGALTTNQWGAVAFAPATAIPNGKYAILGAYVSAVGNAALIRFVHADFQGIKPGFPVMNYEITAALGLQVTGKDVLLLDAGFQFVYLSDISGKPQCPVFTVSNAGTGLSIEMISAQGDTPVVTLVLAKLD